jgi:hypothetical protein
MTRKTRRFIAEPRDHIYRCLLQEAVNQASTAYLLVRGSLDLSTNARDCLERLEPYLISDDVVSEWPGTTLFGDRARMLMYKTSTPLLRILESRADGLYEWTQPNLPEDLGFLRTDGSVWLASTAHEADAWLEPEPEELERLLTGCPEIARITVCDSQL